MTRFAARLVLCVAALLLVAAPSAVRAQVGTAAEHAILLDATTGAVLFEKAAEKPMPPASMSKLMTVYMVFERLAEGRLTLADTFPVSKKAWQMGGSKMFVKVGDRVSVEDLLRGIIIQSGNDACVVVAEGLAGTEEAFAAEMTKKARAIGLKDSTFTNASGWPDPNHRMTARDLATLALRIIKDFPQYYPLYSETNFTYADIRQGNRNPLLYKNLGADGLKTGHTEESGYGLTASAKRGERRLVLAMNGMKGVNERSREAERLLDWGFREFDNYKLFDADAAVADADVWLGEAATVPLVVKDAQLLTLTRKARRGLKVSVVYDGPLPAPIAKGQEVARLVISAPDTPDREVPLLAGADVDQLGMTGRLTAALGYLIWGSAAR